MSYRRNLGADLAVEGPSFIRSFADPAAVAIRLEEVAQLQMAIASPPAAYLTRDCWLPLGNWNRVDWMLSCAQDAKSKSDARQRLAEERQTQYETLPRWRILKRRALRFQLADGRFREAAGDSAADVERTIKSLEAELAKCHKRWRQSPECEALQVLLDDVESWLGAARECGFDDRGNSVSVTGAAQSEVPWPVRLELRVELA